MDIYKKITASSIAFGVGFSLLGTTFVSANTQETNTEVVAPDYENASGTYLNKAMELYKNAVDVEESEENLYDFSDEDFDGEFVIDMSTLENGDILVMATWDGSWTSNYTVPGYLVGGGAAAATAYVVSLGNVPVALASTIGAWVGGYAGTKSEVAVRSTVKYRWVTRYTKCYYETTSKLYQKNRLVKTITKNFTAAADPNTD
ncbi:hypothetical protein [Cytobacillus horneckiae]|uniref:hypothetical protein n=1 Tax=Cytobacillus horneckiae TaxID=549687 RepID=UPI003D9A3887